MKISSIIKPVVILLGFSVVSQLSVAQEKIKGLYYNYKPELGGYELTGPPKPKNDKNIKLEVPSVVKGKEGLQEVKAIAEYAYFHQRFKELILNGINTISSNAFCGSTIHKDLYVDAVNIKEGAFDGAFIKGYITLSKNVSILSDAVFRDVKCNGFIVENGNNKFRVIDGMLLSADTATLLAIPSNHSKLLSDKILRLPTGIKCIGKQTFSMSTYFRINKELNIVLPTSIAEVKEWALSLYCLGSVTVLNSEPPSAPAEIMEKAMYNRVILFVPPRSVARYKKHPEWGKFKYIEEISSPELIAEIEAAGTGINYGEYDRNNFDEVLAAAEAGDAYASFDIENFESSHSGAVERFYKTDAKRDAVEALISLKPTDDAEANYFIGRAWVEKAHDDKVKKNIPDCVGGKNYPFMHHFVLSARKGYDRGIDALYGYGVWGGAQGLDISYDGPGNVREILDSLAMADNITAIKQLCEQNVFQSEEDAFKWSKRRDELLKDDESALHLLSFLRKDSNLYDRQSALERIKKMNEPGLGYHYLAQHTSWDDNEEEAEKYWALAAEHEHPAALAHFGDKYFCGKVEDIDLNKSSDYYYRALKKAKTLNVLDDYDVAKIGYYLGKHPESEFVYPSVGLEMAANVSNSSKYKTLAMIELADNEYWKGQKKLDKPMRLLKKAAKENDGAEQAIYRQIRYLRTAGKAWNSKEITALVKELEELKSVSKYIHFIRLHLDSNNPNRAMEYFNSIWQALANNERWDTDDMAEAMWEFNRILEDYSPSMYFGRHVYDIGKCVDILQANKNRHPKALWLYGKKCIANRNYAEGLSSLELAVEKLVAEGRFPFNINDDMNCQGCMQQIYELYSGFGEISWQGKTYSIPAKYQNKSKAKKYNDVLTRHGYYGGEDDEETP